MLKPKRQKSVSPDRIGMPWIAECGLFQRRTKVQDLNSRDYDHLLSTPANRHRLRVEMDNRLPDIARSREIELPRDGGT